MKTTATVERPQPGAPVALPHERSADGRTRAAVVDLLLTNGPLTAAALAGRLGISPAAVRRHLDQLIAEGAVRFREPPSRARRGRGRPARSYLLTDVGRDRLPHGYDDLAVQALRYLADTAGPAAITDFARRRAESVVEPYRQALDAAGSVEQRAEVLTGALTAAGFAASLQEVGIGRQLCQHHCPVGHVAAAFPQFCEEEMAVLTRELGTYAQRLATIARGDSVCTTFIPLAAPSALRPAKPPADPTPTTIPT